MDQLSVELRKTLGYHIEMKISLTEIAMKLITLCNIYFYSTRIQSLARFQSVVKTFHSKYIVLNCERFVSTSIVKIKSFVNSIRSPKTQQNGLQINLSFTKFAQNKCN
jgi:hypothetical protein